MTASPAPFTIRDYQTQDLVAITAIVNTEALQPYTPEKFAETVQHTQNQAQFFRHWVVEDRPGHPAGFLRLYDFPYGLDGLMIESVVAPEACKRGYGSALLALVVDTARTQGVPALYTQVRDTNPEARSWAERRGFSVHVHRFESVLDLTTFDEHAHNDLHERLMHAGITLQDMTVLGQDEANWNRLYVFFAEREQDAPDAAGMPGVTVEQARQMLREELTVRPEGIVVATRGDEWLGLSVLSLDPRSPYNFFTGVSPEARGLGLARALKVELIRRAREVGLKQMVTHNDSANAPMLAVNRRLGYKQRPGSWMMRRTLS